MHHRVEGREVRRQEGWTSQETGLSPEGLVEKVHRGLNNQEGWEQEPPKSKCWLGCVLWKICFGLLSLTYQMWRGPGSQSYQRICVGKILAFPPLFNYLRHKMKGYFFLILLIYIFMCVVGEHTHHGALWYFCLWSHIAS